MSKRSTRKPWLIPDGLPFHGPEANLPPAARPRTERLAADPVWAPPAPRHADPGLGEPPAPASPSEPAAEADRFPPWQAAFALALGAVPEPELRVAPPALHRPPSTPAGDSGSAGPHLHLHESFETHQVGAVTPTLKALPAIFADLSAVMSVASPAPVMAAAVAALQGTGDATGYAILPVQVASLAAPAQLTSSPTGIVGDSERMVTARMQEHMVVTADGAEHVLANLGSRGGLTLFSHDTATGAWISAFKIANTTTQSTADVLLLPSGLLAVAYTDAAGRIAYQSYAQSAGTWKQVQPTVLIDDTAIDRIHPTIAVGPSGKIWIASSGASATGTLEITFQSSADRGLTWQEEKTLTAAQAQAGSVRVLSTADGIHAVYTVGNELHWTAFTPQGQQQDQTILTFGPQQWDPYRSHFSAVADGLDLHVATTTGDRRLAYLHYDGETDTWLPAKVLTTYDSATYMQMSVSDEGNLYIVFDDQTSNLVRALESTDDGTSFAEIAELRQRASLFPGNPRVETPGHFSGDLTVLQQVSNLAGNKQQLVSYSIDVDPAVDGFDWM